jgi:superfamily II DNA or RNA helicase
LKESGIENKYIYGAVPPHEREAIRESFQRGDIKVVVCQEDCVKAGLDFSAADTIFYFSNSLSGDARIQSEDRIVHLSKTGKIVLIVDIVVEDSVDDIILDMVSGKKIDSAIFMRVLQRRLYND